MLTPIDRFVADALVPMPRQSSLPLYRGRFKVEPADFVVEEVAAYEPSGSGDHLYLWLEKVGVPAMQLPKQLASVLGVHVRDIGVAGMKDTRAVTRQWISVPASAQSAVEAGALGDVQGVRVLRTSRHGNKLKTGHLRGNHFTLRLRSAEQAPAEATAAAPDTAAQARSQPAAFAALEALVADVRRLGLVNAFGQQRFGHRGATLLLGLKALGADGAGPSPRLDGKMLRFALSAVQSALFNAIVRQRLHQQSLHTLALGDVAVVCRSGGPFVVDDLEQCAARLRAHDIVLGGPLYGPRCLQALGAQGEAEAALLKDIGLEASHFAQFAKLMPGGRRPAVIWPGDIAVRELENSDAELRFFLPSGSYATELLAALLEDT